MLKGMSARIFTHQLGIKSNREPSKHYNGGTSFGQRNMPTKWLHWPYIARFAGKLE